MFWNKKHKIRQAELDSIGSQLEVLYNQLEAIRDLHEKLESGDVSSLVKARTIVAEEFLVIQQKIQRLLTRNNAILESQIKHNERS